MLKIFYNLLFPLLFLVCWPYYLLRMLRRGHFRRHFSQRLGIYRQPVRERLARLESPLWIHAVSVGEMMIALALVRALRERRPGQNIVLSTTTSTGRAVAESASDAHTAVVYSPVDLAPAVASAFRHIRPAALVLVEQEIWPNHLWQARKRKVPVWLINGRLSIRSEKRLRYVRRWTRPILGLLDVVCVQDERDRTRFAAAGFPPHALFITGNIKYELDGGGGDSLAGELRAAAGWSEDDPVFMAGSTFPGEEEILLRVYATLKKDHPDLRFLLVPRHVERTPGLVPLITAAGWKVRLRTEAGAMPEGEHADVFILDTTGELRRTYGLATVVFVGKTLRAPEGQGCQNFLEAAQAGKPVVVGPRVENFRTAVEEFQAGGGLAQVPDEAGLEKILRRWLDHPQEAQAVGCKAREMYQRKSGALRKTVGMIEGLLDSRASA
ncbi:MAG: 3-deoxy-D-manno-octulosonic acid transferase [Candidatus Methylacidiphilales bacterium]|nr:3-deoxy-D-manno-octulosonic acid transferase [Candidatus Methylacidiphilales bacterium]